MAGFNVRDLRSAPGRGPLATVSATPDGQTHESGAGYQRDPQSELFLHATTTFVGEDAFYAKADANADRLRALVAELAVTESGWEWLKGFLPWLRGDGNVRTAGILLAVEAVRARLAKGLHGNGNRQLIDRVCQRADEPGEVLAYWISRYGRSIPKPIKRGAADAASRLFTERGFLRYDSTAKGIRFADVLELTHARGTKTGGALLAVARREAAGIDVVPRRTWQDELFRWAITARRGRDARPPGILRSVESRFSMSRWTPEARHSFAREVFRGVGPRDVLNAAMAGQWEWLLSWLGDKPDVGSTVVGKLDQWRMVLPELGYMALLRNLRNLDEAGLSDVDAVPLIARLADPEEVARSRQFPFRFFSAYRAAPSLRWGHALDQALSHSVRNVPALPGQTLVLIDTSGSMNGMLSGKSTMTMVTAAAIFGLALAIANPTGVDVWGFANDQFEVTGITRGTSLLRAVDQFVRQVGRVGGGTEIEKAVRLTYRERHSRVIILTDMQTFPERRSSMYYWENPGDVSAAVPAHVPVYGFNLRGYQHSAMPVGHGNRHEMGGLTDHTFRLIPMIEAGRTGTWPWMMAA
jgi:hypothetical protein